jgi:hypothetical protein
MTAMLGSEIQERLAKAHAVSLANLMAGVEALVSENQRLKRRVADLEAILTVLNTVGTPTAQEPTAHRPGAHNVSAKERAARG